MTIVMISRITANICTVIFCIINVISGDNPEKNVISIADPNAPTTSGGDAEPSTSGGATSADGKAICLRQ